MTPSTSFFVNRLLSSRQRALEDCKEGLHQAGSQIYLWWNIGLPLCEGMLFASDTDNLHPCVPIVTVESSSPWRSCACGDFPTKQTQWIIPRGFMVLKNLSKGRTTQKTVPILYILAQNFWLCNCQDLFICASSLVTLHGFNIMATMNKRRTMLMRKLVLEVQHCLLSLLVLSTSSGKSSWLLWPIQVHIPTIAADYCN